MGLLYIFNGKEKFTSGKCKPLVTNNTGVLSSDAGKVYRLSLQSICMGILWIVSILRLLLHIKIFYKQKQLTCLHILKKISMAY